MSLTGLPNIKVEFSREFEIERVKYTLGKRDWFKEKGYRVTLPAEIDLDTSVMSDSELDAAISKEFVVTAYQQQAEYIMEKWSEVEDQTEQGIYVILPSLESEYVVRLTRYGVGGSYHYPNTIVMNLSCRFGDGAVRNVLHEMVHLAIHPLIQKSEITHWTKERIVDLLTMKINSTFGQLQKIPQPVDNVDRVFSQHYPDVMRIISELHQQ